MINNKSWSNTSDQTQTVLTFYMQIDDFFPAPCMFARLVFICIRCGFNVWMPWQFCYCCCMVTVLCTHTFIGMWAAVTVRTCSDFQRCLLQREKWGSLYLNLREGWDPMRWNLKLSHFVQKTYFSPSCRFMQLNQCVCFMWLTIRYTTHLLHH